MCMNEEQHLQCKMSLINFYESNADGHCSRPNDTLAPSELNCSDCQQHRDKCVSTGIGWNATIRHLRLLTKPAAALGVGSWPLCSVRRLPGEITVLKCGGAEKMKKLACRFLSY